MLTRFVRIQLITFTIASAVGLAVMFVEYLQVPRLMGLGHIRVTLQLPAAGGLYRFSNVTYRGVQIGTVTGIRPVDGTHVEATMALDTAPRIPADLVAHVRSVSAVGEQYVDLEPVDAAPPYLSDGSVIPLGRTTIPQQVGPMLDQMSALVDSLPKDKINALLDDSYTAFDRADYDLGSLLDSSATISRDLNGVSGRVRALIDDSRPLLESQAVTADSTETWIRSLAGITGDVATHDPQVRSLLEKTPGFADDLSGLLDQIKPTLPVLIANLSSVGQVLLTYNRSLEQLLVLLPPYTASLQAAAPVNNPTGLALGDFTISIGDPPGCTVGFLPPSQWRSPEDTTEIDTPDGLYCKLPQDSPIAVRGARNYPCIEHPGKRAATVQDCDSDKPFVPLATRQHVLGPSPIDPNLLSQGVPPDRLPNDERLLAPAAGTAGPPAESDPRAPGVGPNVLPSTVPEASADPGPAASLPHQDSSASPAPVLEQPAAVPNSLRTGNASAIPMTTSLYNPQTGSFTGPDGRLYHQGNLAANASEQTWKSLLLPSS